MAGAENADSGCPQCGEIDQSVKVSFLVKSGTISGQARGSSMGVTFGGAGLSPIVIRQSGELAKRSDLARQLELPEFHKPNLFGSIAVAIILALLAGGTALTVAALIGQSAMADNRQAVLTIGAILGAAASFVAGRKLLDRALRFWRGYRAEESERRTMRTMWETFRYCARDDLAYIPGTEYVSSSNGFLKYLLTSAGLRASLMTLSLRDEQGVARVVPQRDLLRLLGEEPRRKRWLLRS